MTQPILAVIVEGHGEVSAVPTLLRRLVPHAQILKPHRVPRGKMTTEVGRAVQLQGTRVGQHGGVLVLLDADDDDPDELAHRLDDDIAAHASGKIAGRARVTVAVREFEAWFLGGIESLRSHRSVDNDASYDGNPEEPRDAKGRLSDRMMEPYQETIHQVAFSALVDLEDVAQRCPSFIRFQEAVIELAGASE